MVTEPSYSDEELALQVLEGDSEAFAALVKLHTLRFYRLAYRILRDPSEAEDMVQAALLKFWDDPSRWNPRKNTRFTTWFYRVVVNQCLDYLKKKKPQLVENEDLLEVKGSNHPLGQEQREKEQALKKWMLELPEKQRAALSLCFYEGLSNQEAAEVMGVGIKALESLLMRAKEGLKHKAKISGFLEDA